MLNKVLWTQYNNTVRSRQNNFVCTELYWASFQTLFWKYYDTINQCLRSSSRRTQVWLRLVSWDQYGAMVHADLVLLNLSPDNGEQFLLLLGTIKKVGILNCLAADLGCIITRIRLYNPMRWWVSTKPDSPISIIFIFLWDTWDLNAKISKPYQEERMKFKRMSVKRSLFSHFCSRVLIVLIMSPSSVTSLWNLVKLENMFKWMLRRGHEFI